jgi:N-dimethylarginine dimethylaminohydrolase
MEFTCHSETGKIKLVYMKHVKQAFQSESHVDQYWKALNYLNKPDIELAIEEYDHFESILHNNGIAICHLPSDENVNMDSIYCRDAAIATNKGMIVCNMGKPARASEPQALKNAFETNGLPILGCINWPGTVEGGDVAWLDENTLAVGHSYRTNEEGIKQLRALLKPLDVEVIVASLPHYKGTEDVFHLMSILSPVDKNIAVVYSPLMPIAFRNELLKRNFILVEVPDDEFDAMACNVLALSPGLCLMVDGNPKTKALLEAGGCKVIVYKGEEISVKGGGGPTCLTRPVYRYV